MAHDQNSALGTLTHCATTPFSARKRQFVIECSQPSGSEMSIPRAASGNRGEYGVQEKLDISVSH